MNRRLVGIAVALGLLGTLSACDAEGRFTDAQVPAWRLVEGLRFEEDPTQPLSGVRALAPAPAGNVFVLDSRTLAVLRFGPDGRFAGAIGRAGEGPGEFQATSKVGLLGDTLWVVDSRLGRVSLFDSAGAFLTSWPSGPALEYPAGHWGATPLAMLGSGSVLLGTQVGGQGEAIGIVAARFGASDTRVLAELEAGDRWWSITMPGRGESRSSLVQPLAAFDLMKPWSGGLVVVRRPVPLVPHEARYYVVWLTEDSQPVEVAVTYAPSPVAEADVRAGLERYEQTGLPGNFVRAGLFASIDAVRAAAREGMVIPDYLPPIPNGRSGVEDRSLLITGDGTVWVQRWRSATPGMESWDVVSTSGLEARVSVPSAVKLLAVRGGYAWGVVRDSLGVPTIVRLRLER